MHPVQTAVPRPPRVVAATSGRVNTALAGLVLALAAGGSAAADDNAAGRRIEPGNVGQLALAFVFRTESIGADSGAPASLDGTLFVLTPFPHTLFAVDPAAPPERRVKWQYRPQADRRAEGLSCCGRIDHGPVAQGGRVYFTTLDGRVVALDAASGRSVWDVALARPDRGEALTGPPTVAGGRVFVGSGGSDMGTRGWLAALDAGSGRVLWQRHSTGPDADVGIGADFAPPFAGERGHDLGVATWPPDGWQAGGGAVAGPVLVDADEGVVWHGTGPPSPWNGEQRPGDNKWTSGLFARDAGSGAARWFDGIDPHNPLAWRDGGADLLVEQAWNGVPRKLLVHADGNGWLYVVDRRSGEILAADAFAASVVTAVDRASGRPTYRGDKLPRLGRQTRDACPAWSGAASGPAALQPGRGVVFLPLSRLCMDLEVRTANRIPATPFAGANVRLRVPPMAGSLVAWDLAGRKALWRVDERFPLVGGALATDGGLVFYGTLDGWLKAVDARDGKVLWQFRAPGGIVGRPAVSRSADGHEQVAVVSGARRLNGMTARDGIDPRDLTAGLGYAALRTRLPEEADPAATLLVFRLP